MTDPSLTNELPGISEPLRRDPGVARSSFSFLAVVLILIRRSLIRKPGAHSILANLLFLYGSHEKETQVWHSPYSAFLSVLMGHATLMEGLVHNWAPTLANALPAISEVHR